MAALTVTEKEHWKERIERRVNKRIEAIWNERPELKEQIDQQARRQAYESLGLAELMGRRQQLEQQQEELTKQQRFAERKMLAILQGKPLEETSWVSEYQWQQQVEAAVQRRQNVLRDELMKQHDEGRRILALQLERENLLDTVWLATSPTHLRTLWTKVAEILQDQPTPLQQEAMAIPVPEE
jgi:hypothetical protein